jgi:hypothetical protein
MAGFHIGQNHQVIQWNQAQGIPPDNLAAQHQGNHQAANLVSSVGAQPTRMNGALLRAGNA